MAKQPVVFFGHGSPMLALEKSEVTRALNDFGQRYLKEFGRPKALLMLSAHWYTRGTFVQTMPNPTQIYDMYGFPQELYQVTYPVAGNAQLSARVQELLGNQVSVNNDWGIDHGTWTVLVHVFPDASVPVVQLSVDATLSAEECYRIGQWLAPLREEGYLIAANGNIVHNLRRTQWDNPHGTKETEDFNRRIVRLVLDGKTEELIDYQGLPGWKYAIPTPDHYLPLIYALGAAGGDAPQVFNDVCNLGTIAMTSFSFGMEG